MNPEHVNPEEILQDDILLMAKMLSLPISTADLKNVHHHFKLLASHAENFMTFTLDEAIEPAPEFYPDAKFRQNNIE